jgi:hypothetical protein
VIDHAVMAYKGTETDILYGVAMDHAVMAYKGTETDIFCGVGGRNLVNSMSQSIYLEHDNIQSFGS